MPESRYYVRNSFLHILSKIGFFTKTENLPQYNSKTPNVRFLVEFTSFDAFNIHPLPGKFCSLLWFVLRVFIEILRQSKVTNFCSVTILSMESTFKYETNSKLTLSDPGGGSFLPNPRVYCLPIVSGWAFQNQYLMVFQVEGIYIAH